MKALLITLFAIIIMASCEKDQTTGPTPNPTTKPMASFTAPDTICLDTLTSTAILPIVNTSTGATSYSWTLGGMTSTLANPEFNLTTAGDMTLKLIATNSAGSAEVSKQINVKNADCILRFRITTSATFSSATVYYWGDVRCQSISPNFDINMPANSFGGTIGDMKVLVRDFNHPEGVMKTFSSFPKHYLDVFYINI